MNKAATVVRARVANADCYSAGERKWMVLTQNWRGRWLAPWLDRLTRAGVTPDHLTLISLVFGLAAAALYSLNHVVALGCLALHVVLDGIDGPLARRQQTASPRGSFTDTMADQTVVTAVSLALMASEALPVLPGGAYIVLYAVVALFAIARNALSRPYAWLARPRFLFYAWIAVDLWLWPGTLGWLVWCCNVLLAWSAFSGFIAIRDGLGSKAPAGTTNVRADGVVNPPPLPDVV
jgi:phosphatidylglycerophosphate synthase